MHDEDDELNDTKWKVLQKIMELTITIETLNIIPNQSVALCIVLNYLIQVNGEWILYTGV